MARLLNSRTARIPDLNSNESHPMWVGHARYFLSGGDGPTSLFAYDTENTQVERPIDGTGFDITSASAGPRGASSMTSPPAPLMRYR